MPGTSESNQSFTDVEYDTITKSFFNIQEGVNISGHEKADVGKKREGKGDENNQQDHLVMVREDTEDQWLFSPETQASSDQPNNEAKDT